MGPRRVIPWVPIAACVLFATPASGTLTEGILDLLRPGSRTLVGEEGVDPFLSPMDDQTGWWSHMGLAGSGRSRIEYRLSDPAASNALRGTHLRGQEVSWLTSAQGWRLGMPWSIAARLRRPDDRAGFETRSASLQVDRAGSTAELGLRVSARPGLTVQATSPVWEHPSGAMRSQGGAGLRWEIVERVALQGSWERTRLPEELASNVHGNPIVASLNWEMERLQLDGRIRLLGSLVAEVSANRTRSRAIEERDVAPMYQIDPRGSSTLEQTSFYWGPPRKARLLLRWSHSEADIAANLLWGGQQFGQINYGRVNVHSYLAAIESFRGPGARSILEVEWVQARGRARGEAESWPFTTTLVDLLGQRRIYKAVAEAEWLRWHGGIEHRIGKSVRMREGVEWIDAFPHATLESWSPAVLVFGKLDAQTEPLDVRRVQLAAVSLGMSARWGSTWFDLGLEQFVFGRSFKSPRIDESTEPPGDVPAASAHATGRIPGLTRLRLALSRSY
jgi:hypothetical protein